MNWRKSLGITGILATGTAVLLSTSSVCGCEPAEVVLAQQLGIDVTDYGKIDVTPSSIQRAAIGKYRGQPLQSLSAPTTWKGDNCKPVGPSQLDCLYWFESGLLKHEGQTISFFANDKGIVERIEVSLVRRWAIGKIDNL